MSGRQYFAYRSFWPELQTVKRFAESGIDTVVVFPANTLNSLGEPYNKYPANWHWFDKYDFAAVARQFNDILEVNPKTKFLCMVDLNSPVWLSRQLSLGHNPGDSFTELTQALCNSDWRITVKKYLNDFLKYCEENFSDVILSYILACGHTDEWLDHSAGSAGPAKAEAYRCWRTEQGLPPADVPAADRLNEVAFDNLVHDPATATGILEYWRFTNETVSRTISEFAAEARKTIRREVELGAFYGYVTDRIGPVTSGHADYEPLLDCSEIDFLISPGTYKDREIGGGSGFLTISGSERLAGKRHMHECDQRTHTYNRNLSDFVKLETPFWPDTQSDIAGMKREFALSLINGNSLWWFDMWGGFYKEPEIFDNLSSMKHLWNDFSDTTYKAVDEVALIVDPDSLYYFSQTSPRQGDFTLNARKQLNRLGAPFDTYSLNDVPKIPDFDRYKFIIFSVPLEITPAKAEILNTYVLNNNRIVLWLYAPGLSDGRSLDVKRVRQWAGVEYGTGGLQLTPMQNWTAAYLHNPVELSPQMLKKLAADAGVHIYCREEQPVFASGELCAVHTATGGRQEIRLPVACEQVVELFSGRIAAKKTDTFYWEFATPDTTLFKIFKS